MAISVTCACGRELRVKDELVGRRLKCPDCGEGLTVPAPSRGKSRKPDGDEDDFGQPVAAPPPRAAARRSKPAARSGTPSWKPFITFGVAGVVAIASAIGGYVAVRKLIAAVSTPAAAPEAGEATAAGSAAPATGAGSTIEEILSQATTQPSIVATQTTWEPDKAQLPALNHEEATGNFVVRLPGKPDDIRSDKPERRAFGYKRATPRTSGSLVLSFRRENAPLAKRVAMLEYVIAQMNADRGNGRTERGLLDGHIAYRTEYETRTPAGNRVEVCTYEVLYEEETVYLGLTIGSRSTSEFQELEAAMRTVRRR